MAATRHTLYREIFRPSDERLLSMVHVTKATKKKKASILCVALTNEKPIAITVYQVKKSDKDQYKKKTSWPLRQLKMVDGKDEAKDAPEFDLQFEKIYKWAASNVQDRNAFVSCLWKLCSQHLPKQTPEFVNFPKDLFEDSGVASHLQLAAPVIGEEEVEDYQDLTEKEENSLKKLMAQCDFAISNAEAFTEQLSKDLFQLDERTIYTIMASEQQVQNLMQMLDGAIEEARKIELTLDSYNEIIKTVQSNIEKTEENNLRIQMLNSNNNKLLDELNSFVSQLELSHNHKMALMDYDLSNPSNITACVQAAKALHNAINANIHPALTKTAVYQEQKQLLDNHKKAFSQRLAWQLNNLFIHLGNDLGETLVLHAIELTLPKHTSCHRDLFVYADLMNWLRIVAFKTYQDLSKVYTSSLSKLYDREIRDFFENAKQRISGKIERERKNKNGSSQELGATVSMGKVKSSTLLAVDKDVFGSDMDLAEWQKFDVLLERMLSELEPVCLAEQQFCIKFFRHLSPDINQQVSSSVPSIVVQSTSDELLSHKKEKQINEEVRKMMGELFSNLESELMIFIGHYEKQDGFFSMFLLVRLSQHVMSAQDTGSFLSMTFANALVQAKRNFDKFMQAQIKSIEEAKLHKKSKCGILPFISNFEEFACQAEAIFKGSDRRIDLDKWYVKLVRTMFDVIPRLAKEHPKTPSEVIMMENFHHLHALLSQLKISCLDNERKEAKQLYQEKLQAYVTHYFGRPLEKLNVFCEGVQSKVAQGIKEEEIGFQLAYSKQELRKVIKEYPAKEVKKGLEHLYKKVEKHLCEEENLLQVVWHSMQEEFIRQYKSIHTLIERCYPGSMITFEFTIAEILQFFSDIARSH